MIVLTAMIRNRPGTLQHGHSEGSRVQMAAAAGKIYSCGSVWIKRDEPPTFPTTEAIYSLYRFPHLDMSSHDEPVRLAIHV